MVITRTLIAALLLASPALAQPIDPFPTPIPATEGAIKVAFSEFATLPDVNGEAARMMLLVDEPGTRRIFISEMRGLLYSLGYDGKTVTPYLDLRTPQWNLDVVSVNFEQGLQSFAFHHPRLWQVLHVRGYREHRASARLQNEWSPAIARHAASRMDREGSGGRVL